MPKNMAYTRRLAENHGVERGATQNITLSTAVAIVQKFCQNAQNSVPGALKVVARWSHG